MNRDPQKSEDRPRPVVLCILDGWGHQENGAANAILLADTPNYDRMWADCPRSFLKTSGTAVGLPEGQMGNSEVGHMNIGAGRVVMQDLPRIDGAIADNTLAGRPEFTHLVAKLKKSGGICHVMGLLSPGGVHSHQNHISALVRSLNLAGINVTVHGFLDGRDTPPSSAVEFISVFEASLSDCANWQWGTICGRYWAMDRDKRWDRVEKAYDAIARGEGRTASSAQDAIRLAYGSGETDEFVLPTVIAEYAGVSDGDGLIMANFRADRARQILQAYVDPGFVAFERGPQPVLAAGLGMVSYSSELDAYLPALFPPESVENGLGEIVANLGLRQLRIAETEKYAHVTFFLNGGREQPFEGEDRILVPSPKVATYDQQPEMSAPEVTERLVAAIRSEEYDLIVANYANPDMVGHTGIVAAAVSAVETIDSCLGRLREAVEDVGGVLFITADHGNVEEMTDPKTLDPHTAHTQNDVPAILVGWPRYSAKGGSGPGVRAGSLADIAPTLLELMNINKPVEMTGRSLLIHADCAPRVAAGA